MGFSRQEYWSGLPFPSPGELPDPGIEPRSPTLQADTLTSEPPKATKHRRLHIIWFNLDKILHSNSHCRIIHRSQDMEASIDWWRIKGNVEYTYNGTLFSLKKEGNSAICNMDESGGHYAKWNKVGTKDSTYARNQKQSNIYREELNGSCQELGDRDRTWKGIIQRALSFSCGRWISPRDLLYSIEPIFNKAVL